jgi:hypothetical protein
VRRHALTDAAMTALGAGRPDPATIAELRRAQLGKHLLLLREIVRAAPTQTQHAYAHLTVAEHTDPTGVRALLADPLYGLWAAHCLRALCAGHPPAAAGVPHLTALAAAPHRRGRAGETAARTLTTTHDGATIGVRLDDADPLRGRLGLTPTGRLTDAEVDHWQSCLTGAWRLLVTRHRAAAEILTTVLDVIVPVEPDPAARGISATSADAFGAVAMSAPATATELAVGLLHETQHSILNAVDYLFDLHTAPGVPGYSPWRDDPRPASGILHGAYAYLAVTRFWRTEARADPHNRLAAFEFARWREAVLTATQTLLATGSAPMPEDAPAGDTAERLTAPDTPGVASGPTRADTTDERTAARQAHGLTTPAPARELTPAAGTAGGLTAAGRRFVTALRDEVRPWLAEAVEPEVARLAAAANADHRLRWRLRNRRVDPAAAHALADAWKRGAPPPRPAPDSRLIPASRRALENSPRLDLIHRVLSNSAPDDEPRPGGSAAADRPPLPPRHPVPDHPAAPPAGQAADRWAGGRATAGDAAFLRGDGGTALRAYRKGVLERPGDDSAWAGLALVSGEKALIERIEVVAAVFRQVGDGSDPLALARWMSIQI